MKKKKVLIFISNYLPGYKIGGPLNSIRSIIENLKKYYDFSIVTSDRDLGDLYPYKNISTNKWSKFEGANIIYWKTNCRYYINVIKLLREKKFDSIYVNSFFDFKFSIFLVLIIFFRIVKINQIIVAPRGELFTNALAFGYRKKILFLKIAKLFNFYNKIVWHSTAQIENETIINFFNTSNIRLSRVLSNTKNDILNIDDIEFKTKKENFLKVIFLSRISKEKNLPYALNLLKKITIPLEFHIYGPVEDAIIWKECMIIMEQMPKNVIVIYKGSIEHKYVKSYFSKYDIFLFPTRLENFGHVISESLSVGTPVLISNNTPWLNLLQKKLGWDFDLNRDNDFIKVLNSYLDKTDKYKSKLRKEVTQAYANSLNKKSIIKENIDLFKYEK
jgi:glycosyltransferase involved in cell wall biosynthesis